ncbi:MAG: transcription factor S [Thermoprotei archaeon]|nr:MAG: transcription factor S [Thermoprotei archaeon]
MYFCPRCGGMMLPRRSGGKSVLVCTKCGYILNSTPSSLVLSQRIEHSEKEKTIVLEGKMPEAAPKLKGVVRCPKCGYDEVYYWEMQTRAADEPTTRFFKCVKCGYVWREYE